MMNNEFYINYMTRTYAGLRSSLKAGKYAGTDINFKDILSADNNEKADKSGESGASEKIDAWLIESMTLEEYKQYIYNEISEIPMHPSQILCSVSVFISDEGFEAMQKDSSYEKWVLDTLKQAFGFYNPWCSVSGGSFTVHRFGKTKEEYRSDSWHMGFPGVRKSLFSDEEEECFWKKRSRRHKEYIKESQKIADEKKIMKRVYQEAAIRRGDWENMFDEGGAVSYLNLANLLFMAKKEIKD